MKKNQKPTLSSVRTPALGLLAALAQLMFQLGGQLDGGGHGGMDPDRGNTNGITAVI